MENLEVCTRRSFDLDKYISQIKVVASSNIKQVVDILASSNVTSVEQSNNYLIVSGKVFVNVIYLSDAGIVEKAEATMEFIEKQKAGFELIDMSAIDEVVVDSFSFSSSELICSVSHSTKIFGVFKYSIGAYSQDEEYVLNKKTISALKYVGAGEDKFVVAEEIDTSMQNVELLGAKTYVQVVDIASTVDKVVIEGKVFISAVVSENGSIAELNKEIDFKHEIEMKNAMPGLFVESLTNVCDANVSVQIKDEKTIISVIVNLFSKTYLFDECEIETFSDIFSLKNEVSTTYDFLETNKQDGFKLDIDTFLAQKDISNLSDFDDLIGVFVPSVKVVNMEDLGDKVAVLSEVNSVVIYRTISGIGTFPITFQNKFETDKEMSKKVSEVEAVATISAYKVKAGKDLEIAYSMQYKFNFETSKIEQYVKSFESKEVKQASDSAIRVYVTKKEETVFDIARALNVRPEIIESQNQIDGIMEAGQKVYIYSPLNF